MSLPMGQASQAPQSLLDYYSSVEQGSNRRFDQGLAAQAKQAKAQLDNQYRIAKLEASTAAEQLAVDKWYKEQQVQLAQKTFDESIRQFDKTYGLQEADTTGWFGGKETLEREELNRRFGLDERRFGLDEREMERKYGLVEGELLGRYNRQDTLEREELARRFGLDTSKFGLDVAKTAADLRSRPDMVFQYGEFARNLPGLLAGQGGASTPYGAGPQGQTIAGQLQEVGMGGMHGPWTEGPESLRYAQGQGGPPPTPALDQNSPQYRDIQSRLAAGQLTPDAAAAEWARLTALPQQRGAGGGGGSPYDYSGGTPQPGMVYAQGQGGTPPGGGAGLSPDMAYLSAANPQSQDPTLAAIAKTYQQGFKRLGAQSLESMDPNDRGFLQSGGNFLGFDYDRELRRYAGSRLGQ